MDKLMKELVRHRTRPSYSHGNKGIESCAYCDNLLTDENPGKVITSWPKGEPFKEVVCNECLADLEDYPWPTAFTIRDFPNTYNLI